MSSLASTLRAVFFPRPGRGNDLSRQTFASRVFASRRRAGRVTNCWYNQVRVEHHVDFPAHVLIFASSCEPAILQTNLNSKRS